MDAFAVANDRALRRSLSYSRGYYATGNLVKRREFITLLGGAGSRMAARGARACGELALREPIPASRIALLRKALLPPTSDIPFTFSPPQGSRRLA
jgi:hypothetical protein